LHSDYHMPHRIETRIIYTDLNAGLIPYFEIDEKDCFIEAAHAEHKLRLLRYHTGKILPKFPLIFCSDRLKECLEFNLFLIDRRTGAFSVKKNKVSETEKYVWSQGAIGAKKGDELDDKSMTPIAKDIRKFLDWMIDNNVSYEEAMAVPLHYDPNTVNEAEALLPVWRFQRHLTSLVENKELAFLRGNRILSNLRAFYHWCFRRAEIKALPFSYKLKAISVRKKDNTETIFSMPGVKPEHKRAIRSYISNLAIPKTAKQKNDTPDEGLLAYTGEELKLLMSTKVYAHRTYGLFMKCALIAGLRAFEVVQINHNEIVDPTQNRVGFSLSLLRKFKKSTNLRISPKLMQMLWDYTQTTVYTKRQIKHETKFGKDSAKDPLPLFVNRDGERMKVESVTNSIQKVRAELKDDGQPRLARNFHDLRATFATFWAIALVKKGYSPNDIKAKLMLLLSHETFETTQRYLDFAIEGRVGKHGAMQEWVVDIYEEVSERVEKSGAVA
jgi:integrase